MPESVYNTHRFLQIKTRGPSKHARARARAIDATKRERVVIGR